MYYLCAMQNGNITIETLKANRERIIKFIGSRFSDTANMNACIKGTMNVMVRFHDNAQFSKLRPTMANIDKLTFVCFENWLKYEYRKTCTVSADHDAKMAAQYEANRWNTISF
jgi:hypothetical protein